mgnify:CR=1 FL=1
MSDEALIKFIGNKIFELEELLKDDTLSSSLRKSIGKDLRKFEKDLMKVQGLPSQFVGLNKGGLAKKKTTKTKMAKGGSVKKGHTDRRKGMFYK